MLVVYYSLIAALITGFHIFSLKYLEKINQEYYYWFLFLVILLAIVSRYCIYYAMKHSNNPTIVHLLLNFSTFITFFLSIWFLKLKDFNMNIFCLGLFLISIGFFFIQYSYNLD